MNGDVYYTHTHTHTHMRAHTQLRTCVGLYMWISTKFLLVVSFEYSYLVSIQICFSCLGGPNSLSDVFVCIRIIGDIP